MISPPSPAFRHKFPGVIWQIKLDSGFRYLVAELRNEESREVEYVQIELDTFVQSRIAVPESIGWWSGLVAVCEDRFFISRFDNTANPGPGTLIEFDATHQVIRAELPKFRIDTLDRTCISGVTTDLLGIEKLVKIEFSDSGVIAGNALQIPEMFSEGCENFKVVTEYLTELGFIPIRAIDYLESNGHIFFSYYQKNETKGFDRYLHWLAGEEVRLQQQIDKGMSGIAPESFLTTENYLIFVSNRNTLNVYAL